MPSGKADVQSANPPPNLEPLAPAIPKLREAHAEAEEEPGEQNNQSGLKENGLGLREFPNGVELEDARGKPGGVVHAGVGNNSGVHM